MRVITANDRGTWLPGGEDPGVNDCRVIKLAVEHGWATPDLLETIFIVCEAEQMLAGAYADPEDEDSLRGALEDLAAGATEYLQSRAPAGYVFLWDADQLSLVSFPDRAA
jgi:hypothetical protein